jgi:hypothetical protein
MKDVIDFDALDVDDSTIVATYQQQLLDIVGQQRGGPIANPDSTFNPVQALDSLEDTAGIISKIFGGMRAIADHRLRGTDDYEIWRVANKELGRREPNIALANEIIGDATDSTAQAVIRAGLDATVFKGSRQALRNVPPMVELQLPLLGVVGSKASAMAVRAGLDSYLWTRVLGEATRRGVHDHHVTVELERASSPYARRVFLANLALRKPRQKSRWAR